MPRAPKPKHIRQNTERRDIGPLPAEETDLAATATTETGAQIPPDTIYVPSPPPGVLKSTRESWDRYFRSVARHVTVLSLDLDTLERLWLLYDERERAQRELRKPQRDATGKVIRGTSSRVVEGSQGQPRPSGFYMVIARLDAEIRQLEDRVAKHMKSRLTLGLVVGDARADEPELPGDTAVDDVDDDIPKDPRLYVLERDAG